MALVPLRSGQIGDDFDGSCNLGRVGAVTGGFEYEIQPGDSFSAIAAGVSKQLGATVTVEMLEKANPGVDPRRLQVGKKIIIPEPKK